jgi:hypothetical protein
MIISSFDGSKYNLQPKLSNLIVLLPMVRIAPFEQFAAFFKLIIIPDNHPLTHQLSQLHCQKLNHQTAL